MNGRTLYQVRRGLIAACLLAAIPAFWRTGDVLDYWNRHRLAEAAYRQGEAFRQAGRLADAVAAFRQAVEHAPEVSALYEVLADAQFRFGRVDDAIATYRGIVGAYPFAYSAALYRAVGLIELRARRFQAAREDLSTTVALDPEDWLAHFLLGHALAALGDIRGAQESWQQALKLNPGFQPARDQLKKLETGPRD